MTFPVIDLMQRHSFAHGVHPPESKQDTCGLSIHQFEFAPLLVVPLCQHHGKPSVPIVDQNDEVVRGQCIARPDGFMSVGIHAPATGVIRRIAHTPVISGRMEPAFFLEPFPASTQESIAEAACDPESSTAEQILSAIQHAGIVGLGGAAFPTHAKLTIPQGKQVDTVLVNGAECEPYLTTDHRVMLEHADDVIKGLLQVREIIK